MTAPFEWEVRFPIEDIDAFRGRVAALGGRVLTEYAFTDHYYQPRGASWDPRQRALRIREHHHPSSGSEVLLTHVEIVDADGFQLKRSRFGEGKVRLLAGTPEACRQVVDSLGFRPWLVVRKEHGTMYEAPRLGVFIAEYIDGLGWTSEIEVAGGNPDAARRVIADKLDALGVPRHAVTSDPIASLVTLRRPAGPPVGRKVYFCGSIRGGRGLQPLYAAVVGRLQALGFQVLTTHVAAADVLQQEWREGVTAGDIYHRDLRWLAESDLVIAEVSTPSLGVGVEVTEALHLGKPVLVLCHEHVPLSAMIAGNEALRMIRYRDEADLWQQLDSELPVWRSVQ